MKDINLYDIIPADEENIIISKKAFLSLLKKANLTEKELEKFDEFKKHQGSEIKKNCHLYEYKQIWRMIDDGIRPCDIIGNTIYKKNGIPKKVTQRQYYLAKNRRKELDTQ